MSQLYSQESESRHNLCSSSTLQALPLSRAVWLYLSTNLNSAMSTPSKRSMKRPRETNGSEVPPKRKKHTPDLQVLYDQVKEKSHLLDEELLALLKILSTYEFANHGRNYITALRDILSTITTTREVKGEWVVDFDQDFSTVFPDESIAQLFPRE